ncbi:MAG: hypothetical protein M1819_003336 [Sarea resinae]|nr:MAG: hypothetical protein M1819_003336 [Sarea resinae]
MDVFLGKITQQAMNYAIRSGITITSGYAIRQCSRLLKTVEGDGGDELKSLQARLQKQMQIISPAIDMIELIAARGNTSLESAVSLTKTIRYDIQALGVRIAKAASAEELALQNQTKGKARPRNDVELKLITRDLRKLLEQIDDAVPLINLAITTSGARLSSSLPATVSPSRLLQASYFLTTGDSQYSGAPWAPVQIGPVFTLSMYMLFSGHAYRPQDEEGIRETTWKEVVHKARVKLLRVPLDYSDDFSLSKTQSPHQTYRSSPLPRYAMDAVGGESNLPPHLAGEGKADEFSYQLSIVEDLDDDRVHTFEDDEAQPGPYDDVALAGIREILPVHQLSKIFYADTGKILNIGSDGEANSPILLLKRDMNALPPRRMMEKTAREEWWDEEDIAEQEHDEPEPPDHDESQSELDAQLFREERASSVPTSEPPQASAPPRDPWHLPKDLDREWMAFEVYMEPEPEESDVEDDTDSMSSPSLPSRQSREPAAGSSLVSALSVLHLNKPHSQPETSSPGNQSYHASPRHASSSRSPLQAAAPSPRIATSLSLLESLIRLTSLQQFQQASHLAINDELLNFFLEESSTTGAGSDGDARRRARHEARRRVGFDPYDESPIKRHGEDYQRQDEHYGSPIYEPHEWDTSGYAIHSREQTPETPLLLRDRSLSRSPMVVSPDRSNPPGNRPYPSSPSSPSGGAKNRQAYLRREPGRAINHGSPLGRAVSLPPESRPDSTYGTSPSGREMPMKDDRT